MNSYELTIVLPGGASAAKKKSVTEKIEKLVKTTEGSVKKVDDWGKIDLAYAIAKENSGIFMQYELELNGSSAKTINDKLRVENDIIRFLLVRSDNGKKSKQS